MRYQNLLLIYIEQYESAGRNRGYKVNELERFLKYCSEIHNDVFDYKTVQSWLKVRAKTNNENSLARIQSSISVFAEWARLLDNSIGRIPKPGKVRSNRRKPIIINREQVDKIIAGQRACLVKSSINSRTFSTITGLLFVTGMRVGEAINLRTSFVNFEKRSIYVPCGKSPRDRLIPISKSTCRILKSYSKWRDELRPKSSQFFIFEDEECDRPYDLYLRNFILVATALGHRAPVHQGKKRQNLKIHDLRHSFATNSLINIYNEGVDVQEALVQLSSILGHKSVKETYWYIEAVPDLIAAAFKGDLS